MSDTLSTSTFTHRGLTFRADTIVDHVAGYPWQNDDATGPVRQANRWRSLRADQPQKNPGEVHLGNGWLYDFGEATRKAKRDSWGLSPDDLLTLSIELGKQPTRAQVARRAVMQDMARMKAWVDDEWSYVGVEVELLDVDGNGTGHSDATWGIESDGPDDHEETATAIAEDICGTLGEAEQITHVTVGARTHRVRYDADLPESSTSGEPVTYSLAEVRDGTGWPEGVRFAVVEPQS